MRIDQIETLDSIETITDGASSRRNQMLVDLGSELNLGAIDGAAEADLAALKGQVSKLARTYKPFGPVLTDAINDQLRTVLGPSGKRPAYIAERVKKTWELGDGWAKHVTVEVALGTREGSSVRGGAWVVCTTARWPTPPRSTRPSTPRSRGRGPRASRSRCRPAVGGGGWWIPPPSASSPRRSPGPTVCWPARRDWCSASSAWTTRSASPSRHRRRAGSNW
jgi:hypothetical protein